MVSISVWLLGIQLEFSRLQSVLLTESSTAPDTNAYVPVSSQNQQSTMLCQVLGENQLLVVDKRFLELQLSSDSLLSHLKRHAL